MMHDIYARLNNLQAQHTATILLVERMQTNMSTMLDGVLEMNKTLKNEQIRLQEAVDDVNYRIDNLNTFTGNIKGVR